jgi:hypothetical protein
VAGSGKKHCDEAIVAALAAGGNVAAAARHARVSERTVHRRLEDPSFRAKVDQARTELVRQTVGRLAAVGVLATDKLHSLLGAKSEAVQLGAARAVLDYMLKAVDSDLLARQLVELREQVEELRRERGNTSPPGGPAAGGPGLNEAGGDPDPGPDPPQPGRPPEPGGAEPRPVAEGPTGPPLAPDVAPLFPPGGKIDR